MANILCLTFDNALKYHTYIIKFVFRCVTGSTITYMRFVPYVKKNYDYGMLVFLLTFNLITVSSYRIDTVIKIAHQRLLTIAMGIGICLFMSLLVFPIWSGDDLHMSTVSKLQGLSRSTEGKYLLNKKN